MRVLISLATLAIIGSVLSQERVARQSIVLTELSDRIAQVEAAVANSAAMVGTTAQGSAANATSDLLATTAGRVSSLVSQATALQGSIPGQVSSAVSTALSMQMNQYSAAIAARSTAVASTTAAMTSSATAQLGAVTSSVANNNPQGLLVGFRECGKRSNSGADQNGWEFMKCYYNKKQANTILYISIATNGRQINGRSDWKFYVDNLECRGPGNQGQGNLYTAFHGSGSADLHFPYYIGGNCWKTSNNRPIGVGNHEIMWKQTYVSSDSYIGWETNSKIRIEEWLPDSNSYANA